MTTSWLRETFQDESGGASSKRLVGVAAAFVLFGALVYNVIHGSHVTPDGPLLNAVLYVCLGCLGLTSIDKFAKKTPLAATNGDTPAAPVAPVAAPAPPGGEPPVAG